MNPKVFISELEENAHVQTTFLVADKQVRLTKRGDPYLTLTLSDRSGEIAAKVWDNVEAMSSRCERGDFVAVRAVVGSWNGDLQLTIDDLDGVDDAAIDLADYLAASRWEAEELFRQLERLVSTEIKSGPMLRFFDELFADKPLMKRYCYAPAAKKHHHAYRTGLLEHSLSMARIGARLSQHYAHYYPGLVNQDLVIAGCVLHDVGKCYELSFDRAIEYTDEGKLVGHIVRGVELIGEVARRIHPPLPRAMLTQLKHLVLSHHGKQEYGSPVTPKTPEALLLHEIDVIDSRMNMCFNSLRDHADGLTAEETWTDWHRALGGPLYAGDTEQNAWASVVTPVRVDGPGSIPEPTPGADGAAAAKPDGADVAARPAREPEPNLSLFPD